MIRIKRYQAERSRSFLQLKSLRLRSGGLFVLTDYDFNENKKPDKL